MSTDRPSRNRDDDPPPRPDQPPAGPPDESRPPGGDANTGQQQSAGDDRSRREQAREVRSRFEARRPTDQPGEDADQPGRDSSAAVENEQPQDTQRRDPHQARPSGAPDSRSREQIDAEHLRGTSPADRARQGITGPESRGTRPDGGASLPDPRAERISRQLRDQGQAAEGEPEAIGPQGEHGNAPDTEGGGETGTLTGDDHSGAGRNEAESPIAEPEPAGEGESLADEPGEDQSGEIRSADRGDPAPEASEPGYDVQEKQGADAPNPPDADDSLPSQEGAHPERQERQPTGRPGSGESGSPDTEADQNPSSDLPGEIPRQFLDKLANLERWLEDEQIPYALFGSLAASAYIDQGRSLDFNRPHAHDPTERVPDIDLLVPRDSLERIKPYIEEVRNGDFPVKIDTFWAESWVDLRPDAEYSYLTHRELRLPVRTELFSPCKARLLGQEFTTLDPRTLLGLYSTVGVLRKQDVPRVTGLIKGIASGTAPSRFTEQDCKVFDEFMHARKRRYPVFMTSKRAWVGLLDTLPPPASRALRHHVQLRANEVFRAINRRQRREPDQPGG